jgi:hypothetical protein
MDSIMISRKKERTHKEASDDALLATNHIWISLAQAFCGHPTNRKIII